MSHFFVIAILKKVHANHAEDTIEDLMESYNENTPVPEYDEECGCSQWTAQRKAREEAEKQFGKSWTDLRADFDKSWKAVHSDEMFKNMTDEEKSKYWDSRDSAWKGTYRPLDDLEKKITKELMVNAKPDKDCESCKGTGTYKSTYNPKSQWDWYRVGGRWDGTIQCREKELDTDGFNFGNEHEDVKNNILSTRLLAENKVVPYAILTPDGEWHQKGKMGWWGMSSNEMSEEDWTKEAIKIYKEYEGKFVGIGLDCHI